MKPVTLVTNWPKMRGWKAMPAPEATAATHATVCSASSKGPAYRKICLYAANEPPGSTGVGAVIAPFSLSIAVVSMGYFAGLLGM